VDTAFAYALDKIAAALVAAGVQNIVVTANGDVVVRGKKTGGPFVVGLRDPRGPQAFAALPMAKDGSVTTMNDADTPLLRGACHLDPRTGNRATLVRSVSVVGPDALIGKSLARAVFVLGADDGLKLIRKHAGYGAVIVTAENKVAIDDDTKRIASVLTPTP
jgi:FAD:protein FMN transferase